MIIAASTFSERVDTQVAMALGASVQPFRKMTHSVRNTVIITAGLDVT